MLWLSPAFPVGSFAYSHGLEWAVEAGDIFDARSLGGWLVDLLTFGAPRADAILFAAAFRAAEVWRLAGAHRDERARRRARGLGRAAARDDGARFGLRRRRARRLGLRALARTLRAGPRRLSGRRRRRRGRPRSAARIEPAGLRAGASRQRRLRRGAARPDRPDRRARRFSPPSCRASARSPARRPTRPSPTSAPPPSAPTSPPCATRRNIRGCSGREENSPLPFRKRSPRLPFSSLLGKVARSAGWGVARRVNRSRIARPPLRTCFGRSLLSAPHPAFGHLPQQATASWGRGHASTDASDSKRFCSRVSQWRRTSSSGCLH